MAPSLVIAAALAIVASIAAGPAGAVRAESPAGIAPSTLGIALRCDAAPGPGRVRCEVEARPPAGERLVWADLQLVEAPAFASPLKARTGALEALVREPTLYRFAFALAAKERGTGTVRVRVRAAVCAAERCRPEEAQTSVAIAVGPGA